MGELTTNGESITTANLKRLKYLDACCKETLRLYTITGMVGRRGRVPLKVDNQYTIPAKVHSVLFLRGMHRRESYFKDPNRFWPERFLQEVMDSSESGEKWCNKSAYIPFGVGQMACQGKDYTLTQMKLFLINLLRHYRFEALDQFGETKPLHTIMESDAHFPVKLTKR